MKFGVNTWVWTSPLTTAELEKLAPHVAGMGFDWIEVPLESLDDLDHARGAEIIRAHGLGVSACAAMGPDRDLIHPDETIRANGMEYIRGAITATKTLGATNLVGPIYSAVGRTWQSTSEERARDTGLLVKQLRTLAEFAGSLEESLSDISHFFNHLITNGLVFFIGVKSKMRITSHHHYFINEQWKI